MLQSTLIRTSEINVSNGTTCYGIINSRFRSEYSCISLDTSKPISCRFKLDSHQDVLLWSGRWMTSDHDGTAHVGPVVRMYVVASRRILNRNAFNSAALIGA